MKKLTSILALALLATVVFPIVPVSAQLTTVSGDKSLKISTAGQIHGVLDFCGSEINNDPYALVSVVIPGTSLGASVKPNMGSFDFYYVPSGSYTLVFNVSPPYVVNGVSVEDGRITDMGVVHICRDLDADGYEEDVDCRDTNPEVYPNAKEKCTDEIDNDCDGLVNEGCPLCTDSDGDGYYTQLGCLTKPDCKDTDASVYPGATELCDDKDNNCDQLVDESFDLDTDVDNCGSCGNSCARANASTYCESGTCGLSACTGSFANCDADDANGCEVNLQTDTANCGTCGSACDIGGSCVNGSCEYPTCPLGQIFCGGSCVSANTDDNCGSCGNVCNYPDTCVVGICSNQ